MSFWAIIKVLPSIFSFIKSVAELINQYGVEKFIAEVDAMTAQLKEADTREKRVLVAKRANDLVNQLR